MKEEVYFLQDLFNTIQKKAKSKEKKILYKGIVKKWKKQNCSKS